MIAIDTNVLLRYVVHHDDPQAHAARRLIDEQCSPDSRAFVHEVVLAELVWVLKRPGKTARREIAEMVRELLDNNHLAFGDINTVAAAIDAFEQGPADFADYLIAAAAKAAGATTTYTFDRDAARCQATTLLRI